MLDIAIAEKLNRAGFVVAPHNTPEEVPSVKSVSGPARHVGEAGRVSAAQSNLAFLGMWITSNRVYQAELLPFDADAGSSSNMVSSQPGRTLGLQSWSERSASP